MFYCFAPRRGTFSTIAAIIVAYAFRSVNFLNGRALQKVCESFQWRRSMACFKKLCSNSGSNSPGFVGIHPNLFEVARIPLN